MLNGIISNKQDSLLMIDKKQLKFCKLNKLVNAVHNAWLNCETKEIYLSS